MLVLIDWGEGRPTESRHIDRIVYIAPAGLRPLPSLGEAMPEVGVLYINPDKVRSIRAVDDIETRGERLVGILRAQKEDRPAEEGIEEYLMRILREREESRQLIPA